MKASKRLPVLPPESVPTHDNDTGTLVTVRGIVHYTRDDGTLILRVPDTRVLTGDECALLDSLFPHTRAQIERLLAIECLFANVVE